MISQISATSSQAGNNFFQNKLIQPSAAGEKTEATITSVSISRRLYSEETYDINGCRSNWLRFWLRILPWFAVGWLYMYSYLNNQISHISMICSTFLNKFVSSLSCSTPDSYVKNSAVISSIIRKTSRKWYVVLYCVNFCSHLYRGVHFSMLNLCCNVSDMILPPVYSYRSLISQSFVTWVSSWILNTC